MLQTGVSVLAGASQVTVPSAERRSAPASEGWLGRYADLIALAIVLAAFAILVAEARSRYFTPDEALHVELVNVPGVLEAYRRSLWNAHPPLFFLILHFWLAVGRSEIVLRLLPVIFGGAFLWVTYRWVGRLFGKAAGLMALLLAALSPACLPLSAEVRDYSLLLFLSVAALAEFEVAVEKDSTLRLSLASLLLYAAILTHYSALFVVMSLGIYALFRLRAGRASRRLFALWLAFQLGAIGVYLVLYLSHLSRLRRSEMEQRAREVWLRFGYFQPGREGPLDFVLRQTRAIFEYFFGSGPATVVAFLLAVAGIALLLFRRPLMALLLFLPFALGTAAGLLGFYPFSGTRHSICLLPFAAAAIGVALSGLTAGRNWTFLLAAVAVVLLFRRTPIWMAPDQSLSPMNLAVDRVRAAIGPTNPVFVDGRTEALLDYYLGRRGFSTRRVGPDGFWESNPGEDCLVADPLWDPDARTFVDDLLRMENDYQIPTGQRLYVAHLGAQGDPTRELIRRFDGNVTRKRFGDILLFTVWIGPSAPRS